MRTLLILLPALCFSCVAVEKVNVNTADRLAMEQPAAIPDYDLYNMRVDLVRQQRHNYVNENTYEMVPVEYEKLGIDVGNGLFFDLNDNLCIDLTSVLHLDETRSFLLTRTEYRGVSEAPVKLYSVKRTAANICYLTHAGIFKNERCLDIAGEPDSIAFKKNSRLLFSLAKQDSQVLFSKRTRVKQKISQLSDSMLVAGVNRTRKQYQSARGVVTLNSRYTVAYDEEQRELKVFGVRNNRDRLMYTVVKTREAVIVNDKKQHKYKIDIAENEVTVSNGRRKCQSIQVRYLDE